MEQRQRYRDKTARRRHSEVAAFQLGFTGRRTAVTSDPRGTGSNKPSAGGPDDLELALWPEAEVDSQRDRGSSKNRSTVQPDDLFDLLIEHEGCDLGMGRHDMASVIDRVWPGCGLAGLADDEEADLTPHGG